MLHSSFLLIFVLQQDYENKNLESGRRSFFAMK